MGPVTYYTKVDVDLIGGKGLPQLRVGAAGATIALTPSGLSSAGTTPMTWTDDVTKTVFTANATPLVANLGNYRAMLFPNSGSGVPSLPFTGTGATSLKARDFTLISVQTAPPGYSYVAYFGQAYKIGMSSSLAKLEGVGGSADVSGTYSTTKLNTIVARCAGSTSTLNVNGVASTANTINDTIGSVTGPFLSRNNLLSNTYYTFFAYIPRVLTDTEVASVIAQQKVNFAEQIAY